MFKKSVWNSVNFIVGPNGAGKTLLAEQLARQFALAGLSVRFLHSDRDSCIPVYEALRQNAPVREKVERILSGMFGKSVRFEEGEGGSFDPIVTDKFRGTEYGLSEGECHGLKEIILLLTELYGSGCDCLILDEPELHLHPQLQMAFMSEIRRISRLEPERIFFLITHSPFFIDLRFPEDLTGVVVCHMNRVATHIDSLGEKDKKLLQRFLPRFNTYHKQFFFSDNQVFVEGYTDQQVFSLLLEHLDNTVGVLGTGLIDVGGKDELGVFCTVCSLLGTDARIITDLDSLFRGKLRDVLCTDMRVSGWLEGQAVSRADLSRVGQRAHVSFEMLIEKLEIFLAAVGDHIRGIFPQGNDDFALYAERIRFFYSDKKENIADLDTFKTVVLQGIMILGDALEQALPPEMRDDLQTARSVFSLILAAAEAANVFFLPLGCIEHYYTQNKVRYMPVPSKDRLFHAEHSHMLKCGGKRIRREYGALLSVLEKACARPAGL